ncbi:hypothetical protein [Lignipirellula cremea]|uniref:Uncharacterized protein n=1 Tax=Lignipirellula cremea TaxID=2528010 RepID=A0A518E3V4_9BACT|nr:hypothetical protein [Lignipirellula cremea]QDU98771.1 hypothetical protein Pla8534_66450 [Lignipirellula cremea]
MSNGTLPNDEINPAHRPSEIVIQVNGETISLHPADLTAPDMNRQVRDRIETAHTVVFHDWEVVQTLPENVAQEMIALAAISGHVVEIHCNGQVLHNPFQATLSIPLDRRNLTQVAHTMACASTSRPGPLHRLYCLRSTAGDIPARI